MDWDAAVSNEHFWSTEATTCKETSLLLLHTHVLQVAPEVTSFCSLTRRSVEVLHWLKCKNDSWHTFRSEDPFMHGKTFKHVDTFFLMLCAGFLTHSALLRGQQREQGAAVHFSHQQLRHTEGKQHRHCSTAAQFVKTKQVLTIYK